MLPPTTDETISNSGGNPITTHHSNMRLPEQLQGKFLKRFDDLIQEGEGIRDGIKVTPGGWNSHLGHQTPDTEEIDWPRFVKWRFNCMSLLDPIVPKEHANREPTEVLREMSCKRGEIEWGIAMLKAIKDDFEQGMFIDLAAQIEAELAADYLGQAEYLLGEGKSGKFDHVPAAVLAGAVLEKTLRSLAAKQNPPIDLLTQKGDPKTMAPLIEDLKKAGVFVETKAKQLRLFAGIRNDAAHGDFHKFERMDVELMLKGVSNFLAEFA